MNEATILTKLVNNYVKRGSFLLKIKNSSDNCPNASCQKPFWYQKKD